jgi:hypothetical protein
MGLRLQEASGQALPKGKKESKDSSGIIAGVVAVLAATTLVAALLGFLFWRRRRHARKAREKAERLQEHGTSLGPGYPGGSAQVLLL